MQVWPWKGPLMAEQSFANHPFIKQFIGLQIQEGAAKILASWQLHISAGLEHTCCAWRLQGRSIAGAGLCGHTDFWGVTFIYTG